MFRTKHEELETVVGAPTDSSRQSRNLAARMGRWSAAHWKTATFGWLAFVVVAFALGGDHHRRLNPHHPPLPLHHLCRCHHRPSLTRHQGEG